MLVKIFFLSIWPCNFDINFYAKYEILFSKGTMIDKVDAHISLSVCHGIANLLFCQQPLTAPAL